jgi:TolA-binding protein
MADSRPPLPRCQPYTDEALCQAQQVYRDDLARLPDNGWSLFGLAQSLHRQDEEEEAKATDRRFRKIWSKADVQITSSCLCQPGL